MLIQGTINTRSEYLCRYVIGYYITDNSWNHMNGSYNVNTMELLRYNGTHTKLQKECMRKIHYSNMPYFHKLMVVNNKEFGFERLKLGFRKGLGEDIYELIFKLHKPRIMLLNDHKITHKMDSISICPMQLCNT